MIILRFLGIVLTFFIILIISLLLKVDLLHTMVVVTFVLTVDQLICKFLIKVFMDALVKDHKNKEEGKDDQ